jgi:hypothetical protein
MNYDLPELKLYHINDDSQILQDQAIEDIPLNKVFALMKSGEEAYLTGNDLIIEQSKVSSWFTDSSKADHAVLFFMIVISTISTLVMAIFIKHYCSQSARFATFLTALYALVGQGQALSDTEFRQPPEITPPKTAASEQESADQYTLFEIKFKVVTFVIMILSLLTLKIAKIIYNKYFKHRIFIPDSADQVRNFSCHLYLEVINPYAKEYVYLLSIGTSMINVHLDAKTRVLARNIQGPIYRKYMVLEWHRGRYFVHNQQFKYPCEVQIPFTKYFALRRMLKDQCATRLLVYEDCFYAIQSLSEKAIQARKLWKHPDKIPHEQGLYHMSELGEVGTNEFTPYPSTPPVETQVNTNDNTLYSTTLPTYPTAPPAEPIQYIKPSRSGRRKKARLNIARLKMASTKSGPEQPNIPTPMVPTVD